MDIFGIDPAPTKRTVVCMGPPDSGVTFKCIEPGRVREELVSVFSQRRGPLLALWDAPLCLDTSGPSPFYMRQVDGAVKSWLQRGATSVSPGAVGVAHAAQCPHNYITQHVWGLPVGDQPSHGFALLRPGAADPTPRQRLLAEVHPAVALAVWWQTSGRRDALLRYKPGAGVRAEEARRNLARVIAAINDGVLGQGPTPATTHHDWLHWDDDWLDAWLAWRLGWALLHQRASVVGPAGGAGYVLPSVAQWQEGTLRVDPGAAGARLPEPD